MSAFTYINLGPIPEHVMGTAIHHDIHELYTVYVHAMSACPHVHSGCPILRKLHGLCNVSLCVHRYTIVSPVASGNGGC
jgi:hypothetical protein